ncbi:L-2-hydroxyglutarate oxidase [bacterium]|nr:L-2-hydroxyglutarate oxidase [bacterium]
MSTEPRVVIIGGGIVGLATAKALVEAERPARPIVLEKEPALARHQTGHNSGVIHSGIYYKPGSLKARFTVQGAREMVEFARAHGIAHEICGKVVVATRPDELPRLAELHRRGTANGVPGLEMIGPERLREIEPHAAGSQALAVASTGIIDYVGVAERYAAIVRERGGEVRAGARVIGLRRDGGEWIVETTAGSERAAHVINCAGLHSDLMARLAGTTPPVRIIPFRGEYYELVNERESLVKALIYPVPDPAFPFLGVHFTRMVKGGVEAGPNAVLSFKREGYRKTDFDLREAWQTLGYGGFWKLAGRYWRTGAGEFYRSFSKAAFVKALQRLLPDLRPDDLRPAEAGVRAQAIDPSGSLVDDFSIQVLGGVVHVLNAPSPAATASLPIGRAIAEEARRHFGLE